MRMVIISDLVNAAINKPIVRAARAAHRVLERIGPEAVASHLTASGAEVEGLAQARPREGPPD